MGKKEIKIGTAIALSTLVAMQSCKSQAKNSGTDDTNTQQNRNDMSTDSVKLEKRLLKLSKTKYKGELSMGAMCYEVSAPIKIDYQCSYCNEETKDRYDNWLVGEIQGIDAIVTQLKEKGYDVVLDKTEFCEHCSKRIILNPELIFKIRFSDNGDYHEVRSNIQNEYQCLLEFILGNDKYQGDYGEEIALHDNIEIIQKMTGLGKGIH